MRDLEALQHSPGLAALLSEPRLAPLGPGKPVEASRPALAALTAENAFAPLHIRDAEMAKACLAGLWLHHDFLDESHEISQEIHTTAGSYWHALMHRREPDPSNAAYWFRRVGDHAIFDVLARDARKLGLPLSSARWDPFTFIDLCEKHRGAGTEQEMLLRRVQQKEWELLFAWCFFGATGTGLISRPN